MNVLFTSQALPEKVVFRPTPLEVEVFSMLIARSDDNIGRRLLEFRVPRNAAEPKDVQATLKAWNYDGEIRVVFANRYTEAEISKECQTEILVRGARHWYDNILTPKVEEIRAKAKEVNQLFAVGALVMVDEKAREKADAIKKDAVAEAARRCEIMERTVENTRQSIYDNVNRQVAQYHEAHGEDINRIWRVLASAFGIKRPDPPTEPEEEEEEE
jgi:hypothetical protein